VKTAQDEHALFILACGHEFLGYQVHPVVQRSDQAKIRSPVKPLGLMVIVLPFHEDDGFPLARLEAQIDALRFSLHLRQQVVVTLDARAAGCSDLQIIEAEIAKADDQLSSLNQPRELSASLEDLQIVDSSWWKQKLRVKSAGRGIVTERDGDPAGPRVHRESPISSGNLLKSCDTDGNHKDSQSRCRIVMRQL
jgi:hypothetical protein